MIALSIRQPLLSSLSCRTTNGKPWGASRDWPLLPIMPVCLELWEVVDCARCALPFVTCHPCVNVVSLGLSLPLFRKCTEFMLKQGGACIQPPVAGGWREKQSSLPFVLVFCWRMRSGLTQMVMLYNPAACMIGCYILFLRSFAGSDIVLTLLYDLQC